MTLRDAAKLRPDAYKALLSSDPDRNIPVSLYLTIRLLRHDFLSPVVINFRLNTKKCTLAKSYFIKRCSLWRLYQQLSKKVHIETQRERRVGRLGRDELWILGTFVLVMKQLSTYYGFSRNFDNLFGGGLRFQTSYDFVVCLQLDTSLKNVPRRFWLCNYGKMIRLMVITN